MSSPININGVECTVFPVTVDPIANKKARLVSPESVDGVPIKVFFLSNHAKNSANPEREIIYVFLCASTYYSHRYRYLLRKRKFNIMSLSSPHNPFFKELTKTSGLEPTGNKLLDNLLKLITWGRSPEPFEQLFHKALYIHPEWFPIVCSGQDVDKIGERLLEDFSRQLNEQILETSDSMEQVWRTAVPKLWGISLYLAEKSLFSIYGKGMKTVYKRLEPELTPREQILFKSWFFPNPTYCNRIMAWDIPPVLLGYFEMLGTIAGDPQTHAAFRYLHREIPGQLRKAYFAFYPRWADYVREVEEDRERKERKTGRSVSFEEWSLKYAEEGAKPDYTIDPQFLAFVRSEYKRDDSARERSTFPPPKGGKTAQGEVFLSQVERTAIHLADQGLRQKDIAQRLDYSPSAMSKILKKAEQRLKLSWDNVWKELLQKYYRKVREDRSEIPKEERPSFCHSWRGLLKEIIQVISRGGKLNAKELEKELLHPWNIK